MTRNSNLWKHIFASCSSYSTTLGAHCRSRSFVDVNQSAGGLCDRSSDLLPQDGLNWRQHLLFLDKMALTIMHMMLLYANCPLPAYCQKVVDDESRKFVLWNTEGKKTWRILCLYIKVFSTWRGYHGTIMHSRVKTAARHISTSLSLLLDVIDPKN